MMKKSVILIDLFVFFVQIEDCAYPLVKSVVATSDPKIGFTGSSKNEIILTFSSLCVLIFERTVCVS
jgi:hypothetical protein